MTNITKASQNALKPCPFCGSSAAQYPDGDMEGHSIMCSGDRLEIGASCPMTAFGYATEAEAAERWNLRAALQDKAGEVPDDVARYRAIRNGLVYIEPHESGEIYVAGETGVYTKSGDEFDAAIDAIAASRQKQTIFEPCCDKEDRTLSGGCRNCGDPCF